MKNLNSLNNKYTYTGAIHIHTIYSDGTGDIKKITKEAKKAGLDWILITDHNNMGVEEGFINGVCVIKSEEISPGLENHYLALGINKLISPWQTPDLFVKEVREQGGFGIALHPDESKLRKNSFPPIVWQDKNILPDGVEIWNWFSQWVDNYNDKNIFSNIYGYIFRHVLVDKPYKQTLNWWDKLNNENEKIIPAIGGIDAHALKCVKYRVNVVIFPYNSLFQTIANVILLNEPLSEDFELAKFQILNAIKSANNIIINRHVCNKIPTIVIENNNKLVSCGETIELDNNTHLKINLPQKAEIRIVKNSRGICQTIAKNTIFNIKESGKYRVEITVKGKGYTYSNPISVLSEDS